MVEDIAQKLIGVFSKKDTQHKSKVGGALSSHDIRKKQNQFTEIMARVHEDKARLKKSQQGLSAQKIEDQRRDARRMNDQKINAGRKRPIDRPAPKPDAPQRPERNQSAQNAAASSRKTAADAKEIKHENDLGHPFPEELAVRVFVSPTDLANVVNYARNENPELDGQLEELKDGLIAQIGKLSESGEDTALKYPRIPVEGELDPIIVALTDSTGDRDVTMYSGVRVEESGTHKIVLFDELDAKTRTRLVGQSVSDRQMQQLIPIMMEAEENAGEKMAVDGKGVAESEKTNSATILSLDRGKGASFLGLQRGQNPASATDSNQNLTSSAPHLGVFSNYNSENSENAFDAAGSAARTTNMAGMDRELRSLNVLQIEHSTIEYGMEQRFFKAQSLGTLQAETFGEMEVFSKVVEFAKGWRQALTSRLQTEKILQGEAEAVSISGGRDVNMEAKSAANIAAANADTLLEADAAMSSSDLPLPDSELKSPGSTTIGSGEQTSAKNIEFLIARSKVEHPDNPLSSNAARKAEENSAKLERIRSQIASQVRSGKTDLTIRLKPESLGSIKMSLSVHDGVMNAHLLVEKEEVKSLLQKDMNALRQTLSEQGIQAERIELTVSQPSSSTSQQMEQQNRDEKQDGEMAEQEGDSGTDKDDEERERLFQQAFENQIQPESTS